MRAQLILFATLLTFVGVGLTYIVVLGVLHR